MAREFQRALEDMAREAELDKVKSEIEKAGRTDLGKTIEKTIDPSGELSRAFEPPVLGGKPAAGAQPAGAPATPARGAPAAPARAGAARKRSVATGAPTQPAAAAVAPAAPAALRNQRGGKQWRGRRHPAQESQTSARRRRRRPGPEPSTPAGNGTGAADERKRPRRATAPTEPS